MRTNFESALNLKRTNAIPRACDDLFERMSGPADDCRKSVAAHIIVSSYKPEVAILVFVAAISCTVPAFAVEGPLSLVDLALLDVSCEEA